MCVSLVEVYPFGQYLGERFSSLSTFFSLVSSRAFRDASHSCFVSSRTFRDAPHSRFRCGDPKQCLPNVLKILLLALPQIYTRVFHLWKSINLDSAWVRDSCLYQLLFFFASKFSRVYRCATLAVLVSGS